MGRTQEHRNSIEQWLAVGGWRLAVGGPWGLKGGITLTRVDLRRSAAHSAAAWAPFNLNNNECLQHADSLNNGQTVSTDRMLLSRGARNGQPPTHRRHFFGTRMPWHAPHG